jgi:hypothetical protein
MLASLLTTPLTIMTLGAQDHSILNAAMIDDINVMMERHKWTCHICDIQMPGMMEVDHTKGHKLSAKEGIKPICQCCHDRKHLLWAASRKRITLMHAPDVSYPEISQLTWSLVTHKDQEGFNIDHRKITRDLNSRREDAFEVIGHENIEAVFEAILTVADTVDEKSMLAKLSEMDAHIKIVPSILMEEEPEIKVWSTGGFREPEENWRDAVIASRSVGYDDLRKAGDAMRSKL